MVTKGYKGTGYFVSSSSHAGDTLRALASATTSKSKTG